MKKLVASLVTAGVMTAGLIGVEAAVVSSNAAVVARDDYPDNAAAVKQLAKKIDKLIDAGKLTPTKAAAIIDKLKDARDAGVIGKKKFKKLKNLVNAGL